MHPTNKKFVGDTWVVWTDIGKTCGKLAIHLWCVTFTRKADNLVEYEWLGLGKMGN